MKKLIMFGLMLACLVLICIFGLIKFNSNKVDTTTPIFETQNIKSVTLYRLPDNIDGVEVPTEHMKEITAWLGTFTVREKAKDADVVCGLNMFTFRIEYTDGTVVTSGTDTTTIDGVIYYTNKGRQPDCIEELFRANRPVEE